jgi:hypothetical protein
VFAGELQIGGCRPDAETRALPGPKLLGGGVWPGGFVVALNRAGRGREIAWLLLALVVSSSALSALAGLRTVANSQVGTSAERRSWEGFCED